MGDVAGKVAAEFKRLRAERDTAEAILESLQNKFEQVTAENVRYEEAMNEAILNKEFAENQERLARVEIDRLNNLLVRAKDKDNA